MICQTMTTHSLVEKMRTLGTILGVGWERLATNLVPPMNPVWYGYKTRMNSLLPPQLTTIAMGPNSGTVKYSLQWVVECWGHMQ